MAKNDMRWRRTERNLMQAFGNALRSRPVERISVTALAREADINKATFYLHYRDVYDLAEAFVRHQARDAAEHMDYLEEFFTNPQAFAAHFVNDIERNNEAFQPIVEHGFLPVFVDQLTRSISDRLAALEPQHPSDLFEQVMLTFIVSGFLSVTARFAESERETLIAVSGHLLASIREYSNRHFGPITLDSPAQNELKPSQEQ